MPSAISPMLAVSDGNAAIRFYEAAYGATLPARGMYFLLFNCHHRILRDVPAGLRRIWLSAVAGFLSLRSGALVTRSNSKVVRHVEKAIARGEVDVMSARRERRQHQPKSVATVGTVRLELGSAYR
jgi:hypothetical protein